MTLFMIFYAQINVIIGNLYNRPYIEKLLKKPNDYRTAIDGNKLWHAAATELWLQQNLNF